MFSFLLTRGLLGTRGPLPVSRIRLDQASSPRFAGGDFWFCRFLTPPGLCSRIPARPVPHARDVLSGHCFTLTLVLSHQGRGNEAREREKASLLPLPETRLPDSKERRVHDLPISGTKPMTSSAIRFTFFVILSEPQNEVMLIRLVAKDPGMGHLDHTGFLARPQPASRRSWLPPSE